MKNDDYLLTVKEAADELRISPYTLRSWVSQKRITYQKIGRRVFFKRTTLNLFVDSGTVNAHKPEH
jgi:excisionase family DNA binding protein